MTDDAAGRIARALADRGLAMPARLFADAHRPIAPLLADLGAAIGPLLSRVAGGHDRGVGAFLDDERALDRLTERLDELERRRAEPG